MHFTSRAVSLCCVKRRRKKRTEISMNSSSLSLSYPSFRCQIFQSPIRGSNLTANRSFSGLKWTRVKSSFTPDLQRFKCNLKSLFCYDKAIPEENIEKPIGLSLNREEIATNSPCIDCQAKGATMCVTCSGSGLYVDSIMESQGIIVKVRCLGCGGTGNIMCSECRGRGRVGIS